MTAACPQLSRKEMFWRLACIYGAMLYIRANNGRLQRLMGDDLSFADPNEALAHIIPFLTAGLQVPSQETSRPPAKSPPRAASKTSGSGKKASKARKRNSE